MLCRACAQRVPDDVGYACPRCGQYPGTVALNADATFGALVEATRDGPWFERTKAVGNWRGFWRTLGGVLFEPTQTFRTMRLDGGYGRPILFAILMGYIGAFVLFLFHVLLFVLPVVFGGGGAGVGGAEIVFLGIVFMFQAAGFFVGVPVQSLFWLFFGSGINHLMLVLLKSDNASFEATTRVVAYTQATQAWHLIPILGWMIGGIWSLVVLILGLRETHEITTGTAALAVLLPMLFVSLLIVGGLLALLIVAFAAVNT